MAKSKHCSAVPAIRVNRVQVERQSRRELRLEFELLSHIPAIRMARSWWEVLLNAQHCSGASVVLMTLQINKSESFFGTPSSQLAHRPIVPPAPIIFVIDRLTSESFSSRVCAVSDFRPTKKMRQCRNGYANRNCFMIPLLIAIIDGTK